MADLVSPTIKLINSCINKYTDFCAFKDECVAFRQSLCNVKEVLEDVQKEITEGGGSGNTRLRRPMELLQAATAEGGEVLRKCSAKRTLLAFVFSKQLMGMLNKAKADIEEAMRLLQVSSVRIQVSTRRVMDCVSDRLDELHKHINASYTSKHEVADLIRTELQQHRDSQGESLAAAVSDALVKMGVVSSAQDCADQFLELQREADSIRKAKVIYDEEMLEAVKALTAPPPQNGTATDPGLERPRKQGSETSSAFQECMICPISGDIMRDPVNVVESGLTYDRKSLCASLLLYPDLEPGTGQRFDHPLHYAPNIAVRNLIMAQHGDSYYVRHDDGDFKIQYDIKWKEKNMNDLDSGADSHWSTFEGEGAFAEAASAATATTIHGGWSRSDPKDLFGGVLFGDEGGVGSAGSVPAEGTPDAEVPGLMFGYPEEADRVDTWSLDADDTEEKAKPAAAATLLGKKLRDDAARLGEKLRTDSSVLGEKLGVWWRSRRARWMAASDHVDALSSDAGDVEEPAETGAATLTADNAEEPAKPCTAAPNADEVQKSAKPGAAALSADDAEDPAMPGDEASLVEKLRAWGRTRKGTRWVVAVAGLVVLVIVVGAAAGASKPGPPPPPSPYSYEPSSAPSFVAGTVSPSPALLSVTAPPTPALVIS